MTIRHFNVSVDLARVNPAVASSIDDHSCYVPLTGSGFQRTRVNSVLAIVPFFKLHVAPRSPATLTVLGHAVCTLANTIVRM